MSSRVFIFFYKGELLNNLPYSDSHFDFTHKSTESQYGLFQEGRNIEIVKTETNLLLLSFNRQIQSIIIKIIHYSLKEYYL